MRKDLDDNELIRMQQEAVRRVQEMQKKARLTFEESQTKGATQNHIPRPEMKPLIPSEAPEADTGVLSLLLGLLANGKRDPVLAAVLAYLNA